MFFTPELLGRKQSLSLVWIVGTRGAMRTNRKRFLLADVCASAEHVRNPRVALALRTNAMLMKGLVVINDEKSKLLLIDANDVLGKVRQSFIAAPVTLADVRAAAAASARGSARHAASASTAAGMHRSTTRDDVPRASRLATSTAVLAMTRDPGAFFSHLDDIAANHPMVEATIALHVDASAYLADEHTTPDPVNQDAAATMALLQEDWYGDAFGGDYRDEKADILDAVLAGSSVHADPAHQSSPSTQRAAGTTPVSSPAALVPEVFAPTAQTRGSTVHRARRRRRLLVDAETELSNQEIRARLADPSRLLRPMAQASPHVPIPQDQLLKAPAMLADEFGSASARRWTQRVVADALAATASTIDAAGSARGAKRPRTLRQHTSPTTTVSTAWQHEDAGAAFGLGDHEDAPPLLPADDQQGSEPHSPIPVLPEPRSAMDKLLHRASMASLPEVGRRRGASEIAATPLGYPGSDDDVAGHRAGKRRRTSSIGGSDISGSEASPSRRGPGMQLPFEAIPEDDELAFATDAAVPEPETTFDLSVETAPQTQTQHYYASQVEEDDPSVPADVTDVVLGHFQAQARHTPDHVLSFVEQTRDSRRDTAAKVFLHVLVLQKRRALQATQPSPRGDIAMRILIPAGM